MLGDRSPIYGSPNWQWEDGFHPQERIKGKDKRNIRRMRKAQEKQRAFREVCFIVALIEDGE